MAHVKYLQQNNLTGAAVVAQDVPTWPPVNSIARTIIEMLDSKFEFFLGGSRSMVKRGAKVTITETTNYDFYANDSQEIRKFLNDLKFEKYTHLIDYLDDEVVCIMKYVLGQTKIDVVIRKDAKFYRDVFESISSELYAKHLWKGSPECKRENIKLLFNEMFRIAREKKSIETDNHSFIQSKVTAAKSVTNEVIESLIDEDDEDDDIFGTWYIH